MTKIEEIAVNHFQDGCFSEDVFNHEEAMKEISIEFGKFILTNWRDVEDGLEIEILFERFNNSENK